MMRHIEHGQWDDAMAVGMEIISSEGQSLFEVNEALLADYSQAGYELISLHQCEFICDHGGVYQVKIGVIAVLGRALQRV